MVAKARKKRPPHWEHSDKLSEIDLAYEWKRMPSELGFCLPDDDLPLMLAYLKVKSEMEYVERYLAEEEIRQNEKERGKKPGKGRA